MKGDNIIVMYKTTWGTGIVQGILVENADKEIILDCMTVPKVLVKHTRNLSEEKRKLSEGTLLGRLDE